MNFDRVLNGVKVLSGTPAAVHIVVIIDARMKKRMKNGKTDLIETLLPVPSFFVLINARTSVMGMMARVLVSFTVTALSSVSVPSPHMLSHVEAHAVTDDVSLTAVPANIPKASPFDVLNPMTVPSTGNIIAARTLKKNITEIA